MNCKHCKNFEIWETCEHCEHCKYGGHKWEFITGYKTCAICGSISREKIVVHDDKLVFCTDLRKQYVPKKTKK